MISRAVLGRTGIEVSRLCFGTLTMSPMQAKLTHREGARLILRAAERGVNFLDAAELYDSYGYIGEALESASDLVVAAKSYCYDEKTAEASLHKALREIGRDWVDIFMLHEQESIHTLRGHEGALQYLNRQKEKGLVRAVGVSTHYAGCVRSAATFPGVDVIFPIVNMAGIGVADGSREDMERAVAFAAECGAGLYAMKALGGGHLIAKRREAFEYALSVPGISSVAVGMQRDEEVDYNCDLFEGLEPNEALARREKRRLLIDFWCQGCGRCVRRCGQGALRLENGHAVVDETKCVLCGYCGSVCPEFCIKVV